MAATPTRRRLRRVPPVAWFAVGAFALGLLVAEVVDLGAGGRPTPSTTPAGTERSPVTQPVVVSTAAPAPTAPDGGAAPCDAGQIKANNNSGIYHAPGQRDYAATYADVTCFDSEEAAVAAGFRRAQR
jgi:micrococcal nuclease